MKVRGPLVTLAAVAALGIGIWLVNVSQEPDPAPPGQPVAESTTTTAATTPTSAPAQPSTPPPAFPAQADYVGKIPTGTGVITLDIAVDGERAVAYACDGNTVEVWLSGSATDGVVNLVNKKNTSRLDGRLEGSAVVGSLSISDKKWDFTAAAAGPPAGLYLYEEAGVRNSWIVDADGDVTGVQRQADGSTRPAPGLSSDGIATIDGQRITATRVGGDNDDF